MRKSKNINVGKQHGADQVGIPISKIQEHHEKDHYFVALAGNPNSGKTTIFNALTGGRQKTANYAGVTIEKKEGIFKSDSGKRFQLIDLPGLYSLSAGSPEEQIAQEVLLGIMPKMKKPDLAIVVIDATNLERNLYLTLQVHETGIPVIVALNMTDIAEKRLIAIDAEKLSEELTVPVVPVCGKDGRGIDNLKSLLDQFEPVNGKTRNWRMNEDVEKVVADVANLLVEEKFADKTNADWLARRIMLQDSMRISELPRDIKHKIHDIRDTITRTDDDLLDDEVVSRYRWIRDVYSRTVKRPLTDMQSRSELVDRIVLHPLLGPVIFAVIMAILFQAIFTWSEAPIAWMESGVGALSQYMNTAMPDSEIKSLLLDGILAGVGNVLVFLPQIVILFFFIALLEDTGYMSRAAFLLDRVMRSVGLNGHSFIPLLSSCACAVPGIMSTRTIRNDRDRIVTILAAPMMTCAARLPVYTLLIAAFFPATHLFGFISLRGLIMLTLYLGGTFSALGVAWFMKKFVFKGECSPLILEMPSYKIPQPRNVLITVWEASLSFLQRAGSIILALTIIMWFLISYPQNIELEDSLKSQNIPTSKINEELVRNSYMGQIGQFIEPAIEPLGYDWKIGVGLISAFAAREIIVGTLGIIYSTSSEEEIARLSNAMKEDINPNTGKPVWTPLVASSLLVFFVFALMCMSTLATIKKETNGWKWPVFAFSYMFILAYAGALAVYQAGMLLGFQ